MAHVVIPTDFSNNALNAAVYAVNLFGVEGNNFTVVHGFFLPHGSAAMLVDMTPEMLQAANDSMAAFLERLSDALPDHTPVVEGICTYGELPKVLSQMEEGTPPTDIVVMGTQGASGLKEVLMGSNTAAVVQELHTPVLAIPEEAQYTPPKRIVLADDGGHVDKATVKVLLDIARWSKAEVKIVHVVPEGHPTEDELHSSGYDVLLGAIPHSYHSVSGDNVMVALHDLADQSDADLVVVLHRQRGLFEQLFHRSVSTRLAMHTHIPMLVLQQGAH